MKKHPYFTAAEMAQFRKEQEEKSIKEYNMIQLMKAALKRFEPEELMDMFEKVCRNQNVDYELIEKAKEMVVSEGYSVIKIDTLDQEYQLKSFVHTIIPHSREFENKCLFN